MGYDEEHQERRVFHKWFIIAHHLKKWRTWSAQEPVLCQGPRSPHRAVVDEVGSAEKGGGKTKKTTKQFNLAKILTVWVHR